MKKVVLTEVKNLCLIVIASIIYAAGISLFLDPNNLAPGGITGLAVVLNRVCGISTGTLYFILNVPIILLGIWKFGVRFILKTIYAIALVSVFTNYLGGYEALTEDIFLAGLIGGILVAVGIGLIFKAGATTGGTDIIVKILRRRYRHIKTGFLFLMTDVVIVSLSGLVFRDLNIVLYALLTVFICGKALDYVLYGGDGAMMIFIISDNGDRIGERLMQELDVGCTYLEGKGAWTKKEKQVILVVVQKRLGPQVEEIVKTEDSRAFMIESSANEIYGEGYKDLYAEKL